MAIIFKMCLSRSFILIQLVARLIILVQKSASKLRLIQFTAALVWLSFRFISIRFNYNFELIRSKQQQYHIDVEFIIFDNNINITNE